MIHRQELSNEYRRWELYCKVAQCRDVSELPRWVSKVSPVVGEAPRQDWGYRRPHKVERGPIAGEASGIGLVTPSN